MSILLLACAALLQNAPLEAGEHLVQLTVEDRPRSYRVYVPQSYDRARPAPVVLAYHGSTMNARWMASFTGLNEKAEEAGFIAVYPNGTGARRLFLTFNAGEETHAVPGGRPDDVRFTREMLDDLATRVNVDPKRVYAAGMSCGGMMCYRLAAELPDSIAAIAAVAGTLAVDLPKDARAMPVIHFHGTADEIVPYGGPDDRVPDTVRFRSVDETMRVWAAVNGCPAECTTSALPDRTTDGTSIRQSAWGPGREGAEVVLYTIESGGHTWPGSNSSLNEMLGRTTRNISANDLIWDFFRRHPKP